MSDQNTSASPSIPVQKTSTSDQGLVRKLQSSQTGQNTSGGWVKEAIPLGAPTNERPRASVRDPVDPNASKGFGSHNTKHLVGDANTVLIKNIANIPLPSQPPPASVCPPKPQAVVAQLPAELSHHAEQTVASQKVEGSVTGMVIPSESLKSDKVALQSQVRVTTEMELGGQNANKISATEEKDAKQHVYTSSQNVTLQSRLESVAAPVTANESVKVVSGISLPHHSEGLSSLVSYSSSSSEASPSENNCQDEQEDSNSSVAGEHCDTDDNRSQPINSKAEAEAKTAAESVQMEGISKEPAGKIQDKSFESLITANECQNVKISSLVGKAEGIPDTFHTVVTDLKVCLKQGTETAVKEVATVAVEDIEMKQVLEGHSLSQNVENIQVVGLISKEKKDKNHSELLIEEPKVPSVLGTTEVSEKKYKEGGVAQQDQKYKEGSVPDQDQKCMESNVCYQGQHDKDDSILSQDQKYKEDSVPHQEQKDKEDNVPHKEQKLKEDSAPHHVQKYSENYLPLQEQKYKEDIVPPQEQKYKEDNVPYQERKLDEDSVSYQEQIENSASHQELKNKEDCALDQEQKVMGDSVPDKKQKYKEGSVLHQEENCKQENIPQQDQISTKDGVLDKDQKLGNMQRQPVTEHTVTLIPKPTVSEVSVLSNKGSEQETTKNPSIEDPLSEMSMELSSEDDIKKPEMISLTKNDVPLDSEVRREQKRKLPVEDVNESSGESRGDEMELPEKRARVEELSDSSQLLHQTAGKERSSGREQTSRTVEEEAEEDYVEEESGRENTEEVRQAVSSEQFSLIGNIEVDRIENMTYDQMEKNDEESRDGLEEGGEDVQSKDVSDDLKEKEDTKDDEDISTPSKKRKKKKKSYERPRGEGGKFMKEKPDPSVLDEETRMDYNLAQDEDSQGSSSKREVRRFRCEVIVPESTEVFTADKVVEYVWPLEGIGEHYFIQEQISQYLGIMSFKRKYPDLRRRPIDMQERDYLKEKGLVSEIACDLGLTAVRSEDVLDVMFNDFPGKFEELQRILREKKENEIRERGKVNYSMANIDKSKMQEYGRKAAADAARWNANFNKEKREERRYSFDLQTFTLQMPVGRGKKLPPEYTKIGWYPVSVLPGQFTDYYQEYSSQALKTMPLVSVVASPVIPDTLGSDGASSESEEEGTERSVEETSEPKEEKPAEVGPRCKVCNGSKNRNKSGKPEPLIICGTCRSASHPTCIDLTLVMVPKIESYNWQCMDCKTCVTCSNPDDEDKMIFCDMCDRGYHIFCVGLRRVPNGRWHCKECAMCSSCGSKTPAGSEHLKNAEWQHEFKKDKDNKQLRYATTLCVPCDKYWKRRQFCYVCLKVYRSIPEDGMVRCSNCPKYIHREGCSTVYENERFCINCFKMRNSTALNHSRIIAAAKKKMASGY